jgi:hypothetical protein
MGDLKWPTNVLSVQKLTYVPFTACLTNYPHCGKALRRAGLWKQESYPQRSEIPTLAAIALKMAGTRDRSVSEVDSQIQESYRTGLY